MRIKRPGTYVPLATHFYDDPKIVEAGEDAELLFVRMLAFASGQPETEGVVPDAVVRRLTPTGSGTGNGTGNGTGSGTGKIPERLANVGLIERVDSGWLISAWLRWNRSVADIERDRVNDRRRKKPATRGGTANRPGKVPGSGAVSSTVSGAVSCTDSSTVSGAVSCTPDEQMNRYITPSLRSGVQGGDNSDEPHLPDVVAAAPTAPATAEPKRDTARGSRLPDGWFPARTPGNERAESGHSQQWLERELTKFRNYWIALPGARGRKTDWNRTWQNWLARAEEMNQDNPDHLSRRQQEIDAQYARAKQRAATGINPLLELIKEAS